MLKKLKLCLISTLILIFLLSSCVNEANEGFENSQIPVNLNITQGKMVSVVTEDLIFHSLLNEPNEINEKNAPAPNGWQKLEYDSEESMVIHVNNCEKLDLLDLILYEEFDPQGRPKAFQYISMCGGGFEIECTPTIHVSNEAKSFLDSAKIYRFAFSGICIKDELDANSFIIFLEK